jgi:hypothetical protein
MSAAFHPETVGHTQEMNALMEQYVGMFVNHHQDDWLEWFLLAVFTSNNATSELMMCTPFTTVQEMDACWSVRGCLLAAIMILDTVTECIHNHDMQNSFGRAIQVVSDMLCSGSSCWSQEVWVLCSNPDTLPDMCGNHTRQLIVKSD